MKFPLKQLISTAIGWISNLIDTVTPDEVTEQQKKQYQMYVCSVYALLKNFGQHYVGLSENDLDDKAVEEAIEVCELFADKYGLELNAKNL